MTKLYEFSAKVIIKVEANHINGAVKSAEELTAELEESLPIGCVLVQKGGQAEVCFIQVL